MEKTIKQLETIAKSIQSTDTFRDSLRDQFIESTIVTKEKDNSISYRSEGNFFTTIMNTIFKTDKNNLLLGATGALVLGVFMWGTSSLITTSKPGDILYGANRAIEPTEVALASLFGEKAKGQAYMVIAEKRVTEMSAILGESKPVAMINSASAQTPTASTMVAPTADQTDKIITLESDFETAYDKAMDSLDALKGQDATKPQAEELANTIANSGETLQNTLVNIRGKVNGDTSFAIDDAIQLSLEYEGETYKILYFDLTNKTGDQNQALPQAKVQNRIAKAKRELEKANQDIADSESKVSAENLQQAKVLYAAALNAVKAGEDAFTAGDMKGAFEQVDLAYNLARQIKVYLREGRKDEKRQQKDAQRTIDRAEKELKRDKDRGEDTAEAEIQLTAAKKAFSENKFEESVKTANSAALNAEKKNSEDNQNNKNKNKDTKEKKEKIDKEKSK